MQTICKTGNYTKFGNGNKKVLAFVPTNENDNTHKVLNVLRQHDKSFNSHQICEDKEQENLFENILYVKYDFYGNLLDQLIIYFDFENETVTVNNKKMKIERNNEFVYKVLKTKIKAIDGTRGFYRHIVECINLDSPMHGYLFGVMKKINQ